MFAYRYPGFRRRDGALLLAAILWSGSASGDPPAAAAPDPAIGAHTQTLDALEQRIRALGEALAGNRDERQNLIAELEAREREVAALLLDERALERQVARQHQVADALRVRQFEEQEAWQAELDRLSELLRTAHALGRADWLRLLLNQEDPARASRILSYFAYLNRERPRRIEAVRARAEQLARLAQDAERELARLGELIDRQASTRSGLETARDERAGVLARLEADIASRAGDLRTLERDAEALRQLIDHLRQRAQIQAELDIRRESMRARRGRLSWPLSGARALARFGQPKAGDAGLRWDGILLAARAGEEVRAVHDGQVVHADWLRGFGLLLILDHGDGLLTLYGHNDALLREPGEWVTAGDPIALTGSSGGRDRPALYFAIRDQGRPQDPADWCTGGVE